jgi:hypothetical protein
VRIGDTVSLAEGVVITAPVASLPPAADTQERVHPVGGIRVHPSSLHMLPMPRIAGAPAGATALGVGQEDPELDRCPVGRMFDALSVKPRVSWRVG